MIYWPLLTSNSLKWAVFQVCILAIESLPHLDNKCILLSYFTVQNRFKIKILIGSQMRDFMKEHLKLPKKSSHHEPLLIIFLKKTLVLYTFTIVPYTLTRTVEGLLLNFCSIRLYEPICIFLECSYDWSGRNESSRHLVRLNCSTIQGLNSATPLTFQN